MHSNAGLRAGLLRHHGVLKASLTRFRAAQAARLRALSLQRCARAPHALQADAAHTLFAMSTLPPAHCHAVLRDAPAEISLCGPWIVHGTVQRRIDRA